MKKMEHLTNKQFKSQSLEDLKNLGSGNKKFIKLLNEFTEQGYDLFHNPVKDSGLEGISLRKVKDRWTASIYCYRADGTKTSKSKTAATKNEIKKLAYDYQQNELIFQNGKYYLPEVVEEVEVDNTPTVIECYKEYINYCEVKGAAVTSIEVYRNRLNFFLVNPKHDIYDIGNIKITDLKVPNVIKLLSSMKPFYSPVTINTWKADLGSAFNHAMRLGHLPIESKQVFQLVEPLQTDDSEPAYLQPDEMKAVLNSVHDTKIELLIWLLANTGMRIGESRGLSVKNVDFETGVIHIKQQLDNKYRIRPPKTNKMRSVQLSLNHPLLQMLQNKVDELKLLFKEDFNEDMLVVSIKPDRSYWSRGFWDTNVKGFKSELPFKVNSPDCLCHSLRHTWTSIAYSTKEDTGAITRTLGHSDEGFSRRKYAHSIDGEAVKVTDAVSKKLGVI